MDDMRPPEPDWNLYDQDGEVLYDFYGVKIPCTRAEFQGLQRRDDADKAKIDELNKQLESARAKAEYVSKELEIVVDQLYQQRWRAGKAEKELDAERERSMHHPKNAFADMMRGRVGWLKAKLKAFGGD
jgi:hypothetical protein